MGCSEVTLFLILCLAVGGFFGFFFTWIVVAIACGCLALACTAVMVYYGADIGVAIGYAFLSIYLLQVSYLLVGILLSISKPMQTILDVLNNRGYQIKFFILGWRNHTSSVAQANPHNTPALPSPLKTSGLDAQAGPVHSTVKDGQSL